MFSSARLLTLEDIWAQKLSGTELSSKSSRAGQGKTFNSEKIIFPLGPSYWHLHRALNLAEQGENYLVKAIVQL